MKFNINIKMSTTYVLLLMALPNAFIAMEEGYIDMAGKYIEKRGIISQQKIAAVDDEIN